MIINHNIPALNTLRQLNFNSSAASTSLERLSSGLRINSAADDAAGLAISEKMKTQIRGLDQASRNAQDGISLIQTAEGALEETESILQRMRELAVQATNDTNTDADRTEIQAEIDQLISEIDRISSTTEFNTKKLLNGNVASTATVSAGNAANIDSAVVTDAILDSGTYTLTVSGTANKEITDFVNAGTGTAVVVGDITIGDATVANYGSYQLKVTEDTDNAGMYKLSLVDATSGEEISSQNNVDLGTDTVTLNGITISTANMTGEGTVSFDVEGDHTFTLTQGTTTVATITATNLNKSEIDIAGMNLSFNDNIGDGTATITVVNNSLTLQIGANAGQTMKVAINDMGSIALGVDQLDVSTADGAESAITAIDDAVALVSHERAKLGAYQNRLDHTINNLGTSSENLSSAQSNIADVDMAKEQVEYTKESILVQSATAMLAQANAQPQNVLSLLSQ